MTILRPLIAVFVVVDVFAVRIGSVSAEHPVKSGDITINCKCSVESPPAALVVPYKDGPYDFLWMTDVDKEGDQYCYYQVLKNLSDKKVRISLRKDDKNSPGLGGEFNGELIAAGGMGYDFTQMHAVPKTPANHYTLGIGYGSSRSLDVQLYRPDEEKASAKVGFAPVPRVGGMGPAIGIAKGVDFKSPIISEIYRETARDDDTGAFLPAFFSFSTYQDKTGNDVPRLSTVHLRLTSQVVKTGHGYTYHFSVSNLTDTPVTVTWLSLGETAEPEFIKVFKEVESSVIEAHASLEKKVSSTKPPRFSMGVIQVRGNNLVTSRGFAPTFLPV
jgi:hypothetical protein